MLVIGKVSRFRVEKIYHDGATYYPKLCLVMPGREVRLPDPGNHINPMLQSWQSSKSAESWSKLQLNSALAQKAGNDYT